MLLVIRVDIILLLFILDGYNCSGRCIFNNLIKINLIASKFVWDRKVTALINYTNFKVILILIVLY